MNFVLCLYSINVQNCKSCGGFTPGQIFLGTYKAKNLQPFKATTNDIDKDKKRLNVHKYA